MSRLGYVAMVLGSLAGCLTEGERAASGRCPIGEICSPATPSGLLFAGPSFGDVRFGSFGVHDTAVGGVQDVTVEGIGKLPFAALSTNGAITVDAPIANTVRLHGVAAGDALLRIVEPGTDALYDRVTVLAGAIDRIDLGAATRELLDQPEQIALLEGASVDLVAQLYDASGNRLVDEGLTIEGAVERLAWDTATVQAQRPEAVLTITAGDRPPVAVSLPVVAGIDEIVADLSQATPAPLAGESTLICFDGHAGDRTVVGMTWTVTATGADRSVALFGRNCLSVSRMTAGRVTVHAESTGHSRDVDVDFTAAASARRGTGAELDPRFAATDATPGERAASAE